LFIVKVIAEEEEEEIPGATTNPVTSFVVKIVTSATAAIKEDGVEDLVTIVIDLLLDGWI